MSSPCSKSPPMISGSFSTQVHPIIWVKVDENLWIYRKGNTNFVECFDDHPTSQCLSIFDPRTVKNQ